MGDDSDDESLFDVEGSYEGEGDLHRHVKNCAKNPNHERFTPVHQFTMEHLPDGCHDDDLFNLITAIADLTVRVSLEYVSDHRPQTYPINDRPYPFYKFRGREKVITGSGWVTRVEIVQSDATCPCQKCENSPEPKTRFAYVHIFTAAHVVYDDKEAARTTCHLFFDEGGKPQVCDGAVELSGFSVVWMDAVRDKCEIVYVGHDIELAMRLDNLKKRRDDFWQKISKKYFQPEKQSLTPGEMPSDRVDNLTVIVSHPHGCSKQVSVGYRVGQGANRSGLADSSFKYSTATCRGSSGAYVLMVLRDSNLKYFDNFIHCGKSPNRDEDLNVCREMFNRPNGTVTG